MPSATEPTIASSPAPSRLRVRLEGWNRRLHYYAGLFLLFFLWLFAGTGLVLNHPGWNFANYWESRRETTYERALAARGLELRSDLAQAQEILRQLGIEGEILWTTPGTNGNPSEFQVRRPGHIFFIKTDPARTRATVRQTEVNLWGVTKVLHTFTGVQVDDARQSRDWGLTTVWAFAMDAVAAGLIFMVLSSLYLWWERPETRLSGAIALGLGTLICGLFCVGLRWLY